jgi:outer membrane protein TolC
MIPIAFNHQPDIKSSFQRFKSEEARYDFFYVSRDSLTPRLALSNNFSEVRTIENTARERDHSLELTIEKRFFDTTELNVGVGLHSGAVDQAIGDHPFVSASLRYPLWVSREKLERTSEEIFRRNELNDAQLGYIQQVRRQLMLALFKFYEVVDLDRRVAYAEHLLSDLKALAQRLESRGSDGFETDRSRLQAEIATVTAEVRNIKGRREIDVERLKSRCGLAFHTAVELIDGPFNPFEGMGHEELLRLSIETDPEIATLRNEVRNAEVQLDLARRGRWDLALQLAGSSALEGRGEDEGLSDWTASVGMEVSAVDPRVTDSLVRQAEANIQRFTDAITARQNMIFVDTLEPLIRIETLGASRDELVENLPRFERDFATGVQEYFAGQLNIDDLLKRRDTLFGQQEEISGLTLLVGFNVAELCAATGKFFELLDGDQSE